MNELQIDKQNGNIGFNEAAHKYFDLTDPSIKFTSVTTMIEEFAQPFDKEFWSAYKALEKLLDADSWKLEKKSLLSTKKFDNSLLELYDIDINLFNKTQQGILDDWDAENRRSCERGTKIHSELENSMYKAKRNINLSKYQIGGRFECQKDRTTIDLENAVYPEYLIHWDSPSGKLHIAGQIDLLVKKGNSITIGDYKTNKKIETKSFFDSKIRSSVKMKFPLNNLDDCNYYHYCLQLSTYAYIIESYNPDFTIEELVLVHFDHQDNMTVYKLPYLKKEVERMLSFYEKEHLLAERRLKNKRIEY